MEKHDVINIYSKFNHILIIRLINILLAKSYSAQGGTYMLSDDINESPATGITLAIRLVHS